MLISAVYITWYESVRLTRDGDGAVACRPCAPRDTLVLERTDAKCAGSTRRMRGGAADRGAVEAMPGRREERWSCVEEKDVGEKGGGGGGGRGKRSVRGVASEGEVERAVAAPPSVAVLVLLGMALLAQNAREQGEHKEGQDAYTNEQHAHRARGQSHDGQWTANGLLTAMYKHTDRTQQRKTRFVTASASRD